MTRIGLKYSSVLLVCLVLTAGLEGAVREPAVAGSFYPADSSQLADLVQSHLDMAGNLPEINGQIIALVVPHAGLAYSGKIAAYSYKLLEDKDIENVILCGPSHRFRFDGLSVFGPFVTWKTPLGSIKCNNDLCDRLINYNGKIEAYKQAHVKEHSLEVQLPYLQSVLSDFQIIPIVMGNQTEENANVLAEEIGRASCRERV